METKEPQYKVVDINEDISLQFQINQMYNIGWKFVAVVRWDRTDPCYPQAILFDKMENFSISLNDVKELME